MAKRASKKSSKKSAKKSSRKTARSKAMSARMSRGTTTKRKKKTVSRAPRRRTRVAPMMPEDLDGLPPSGIAMPMF